MVIWILIVAISASCVVHNDHPPAPDAPADMIGPMGPWSIPATLRPVAEPSALPAWTEQLRRTVDDINFGIRASTSCGDMFSVGDADDGHDVRIAADCGGLEDGLLGGESGGPAGVIVVKGTPVDNADHWQLSPLRGTIAHELGHAIGLGHADLIYGDSMMTSPPDTQMRIRDVYAIACHLGCGPCDAAADPYDD